MSIELAGAAGGEAAGWGGVLCLHGQFGKRVDFGRRHRRARQSGLVGVLGGTKTLSHDESCDWPSGQTDGQAGAAGGICFPVSPQPAFLGWKHSESNEFSSGEEESFGSESRVNRRRVFFSRRRSPRGFRYDGGMELRAWLL